MKTIVKIDPKWEARGEQGLEAGTLSLITDIDTRAKILAPKDKRVLVNSSVISRIGRFSYQLRFGSAKAPYARKRHYENKKTPQSIKYLERAADGVGRGDKRKHFKDTL